MYLAATTELPSISSAFTYENSLVSFMFRILLWRFLSLKLNLHTEPFSMLKHSLNLFTKSSKTDIASSFDSCFGSGQLSPSRADFSLKHCSMSCLLPHSPVSFFNKSFIFL